MKIEISRHWLSLLICLIITGYFMFHSIQGAHGYRRMKQVQEELVLAKEVAEEKKQEKEILKAKVQALSPNSLDLDQLEESSFRVLNVVKPDNKVIFFQTENSN